MADVVGVVFQEGSKTYHFDSAGLELVRGDRVVVQTSKGAEIGQVVEPPHHVEDSELPASLKKVVRVATGKDLEAEACNQCRRKEVMATCRELIAQHGLDMKLVGADLSFGGERVTFNFYSDERVDFRALVADLARVLKMRVELRQIGAREEARMVGGLGPCGRHLCCTLFPGDDEPVSIRMAKEQNLPLNPVKISGLCGRLMCCLKYEQEQYVTFRREAPSRGTRVITPAGDGAITGFNVPKEAITVRLEDGSYADLRLSDCELQEDGSLLFTPPQEEEPAYLPNDMKLPELGLPPTVDLSAVSETLEAGASPAEVRALENGAAPSEEGQSKRRSRRSRNRRGKAKTGAGAGSGEGGAAKTSGSGSGAAGAQSGRQSQRRDSQQHKDAGKDSSAKNEPRQGGAGSQRVQGEGGDQAAGGERKPRRRRRPRRSGSGNNGGESGGGSSSGNAGDKGGNGE